MKDRRTQLVVLTGLLVSVGLAVYLFGHPGPPAARVMEAAGDVLLPVAHTRDERARREALRAELAKVLAEQLASWEAGGGLKPQDQLSSPAEGFYLTAFLGGDVRVRRSPGSSPPRWVAAMTYWEGVRDEACAVAISDRPAYAAGIPLRRSGKIRCSWDLATLINRLR